MVLLLVFGFLAGVVTAISPCVLPVLPILLAGGAAGGRRRPYAIVAGLVLSFAVFTLTTAWLIDRLGLPDDLLRNVALGLLFVVAATLLHPRLGELAERPFLPPTRRRPGGLGGGVAIALAGVAIVFHADTRAQTALGGYTNRLQDWIEGNGAVTRRLRGEDGSAALAATKPAGVGLEDLGRAPDFRGISHWLNTPGDRPLSLAGLRGKVVLVDFWTYSCINCLRTLPHLEAWGRAYRRDGL